MARRHGPFDAVLVPINGAAVDFPHLQPPSPLAATLEPEQARIAGELLGARTLVPIHYDGYAIDPWYLPVARSPPSDSRRPRRDAPSRLETLEPGESLEVAPRRLLGLGHDPDVRLRWVPAARELLLRLVVGDRGGDDHVSPCFQFTGVATLCLAVSCRESMTRSTSSKLRPVRHRVGEDELDLLVGADDEDRADGRVVGRVRSAGRPSRREGSCRRASRPRCRSRR